MKKKSKFFIFKIVFLFFLFVGINDAKANTPTIYSVSPKGIVPGETIVTISGIGFGDSSSGKYIYFGYSRAYSSSWSDTKIIVKTPYSLYSSGDIEISGSFEVGETCYRTNCYPKTEYMDLTYPYYLQPEITSLSKTYASPGDEVAVYGTSFGDNIGSLYYADTNKLSVISWTNSKLVFTVPDHTFKDYFNIKIKTTSNLESNVEKLYLVNQPLISSISPDTVVPGETYVTVNGVNFGENFYSDTLYMGGVKITKASWSDKKIGFVAPSNITSGKVQVRRSKTGGTTDFAEKYYYLQPVITSTSQIGAEGDSLDIYGSYLNNIFPSGTSYLQVYVGSTACGSNNITNWASNNISIKIPPGANDGVITLEYTNDDFDKVIKVFSNKSVDVLKASANDEYSAYQQYIQAVNIDDAWSHSTGDKKVVVAVIDDGIYINHPELQNNIWQNENEIIGNEIDDDKNGYIDDRLGWDFVSDTSEMTTRGTHGTMVSGIIGAVGNNGIGITGINWNVKLMSLIVCDDKGCNKEAISKAIMYAVDNGADVINLSLSTQMTIGYTTFLDEAIKYAFDKNVLIVAAAGNGDLEGGLGQNLDLIPQSPVCNDGNNNMVLGVASVDDDYYETEWTNYGKCVDIYAPGTTIISTAVPVYSTFEGFYDYGSGTSFSAPIVSGIAALIKAKYPDISNEAIRDRIINYSNQKTIDAYKAINIPFSDNERVNISNIEKSLVTTVDKSLTKKLNGKILLQVEESGEGWYVNPDDEKKYYLGRPVDAFKIMRELGLGISENSYKSFNGKAPLDLSGKILLRVEANGEAYYVNPIDRKMYYLGRPEDAFQVMKDLGLGITNNDIRKIDVGEI